MFSGICDCLSILVKKYGDSVKKCKNNFLNFFKKFEFSEDVKFRTKIGYCWIDFMKIERDILFENFEFLISFFFDNYRLENYEMNLSASEFFLYLLENYENELKAGENKMESNEYVSFEKNEKLKTNKELNFSEYLKEYELH